MPCMNCSDDLESGERIVPVLHEVDRNAELIDGRVVRHVSVKAVRFLY